MKIQTQGYMRGIVEKTIRFIFQKHKNLIREARPSDLFFSGVLDTEPRGRGRTTYQQVGLYVNHFIRSFLNKISNELRSIPLSLPSNPKGISTFGDLLLLLSSEHRSVTQDIAASAVESGMKAKTEPSNESSLTSQEEIRLARAIDSGAGNAEITLEDAEYLLSLARGHQGREGYGARSFFFALSLPILLSFFWRVFYPKRGISLVRKWEWEMRTLGQDEYENKIGKTTAFALERAATIIDLLGSFLNLVRNEIFFHRESAIYQITPELILKAKTPGELLWFIILRIGNPGNNYRGRLLRILSSLSSAYQKPHVVNKKTRSPRNPELVGAISQYPSLFPSYDDNDRKEIYSFDSPEEAKEFANRYLPFTTLVGKQSVAYVPPEVTLATTDTEKFDDEIEDPSEIMPQSPARYRPDVTLSNKVILSEIINILKEIRVEAARRPSTIEGFFKLFFCDSFLYSLQPNSSQGLKFERQVQEALNAHPDVLALLRQVKTERKRGDQSELGLEGQGGEALPIRATPADVEKFLGIAPGDERGKGGTSDSEGGILGIEDISLIVVSTYLGEVNSEDVNSVLKQIEDGLDNYSRLENTLKVARKRAKRAVKDISWKANPKNGLYVQIAALVKERLGIDLSPEGNPLTDLLKKGAFTEGARKKRQRIMNKRRG